MKQSFKTLLLFILIYTSFSAFAVTPTPDSKVPLIPRKVIFSNPDKANPTLSPNGKFIAFLAPVNQILNVWIADVNSPDKAIPITKEQNRDIISYSWTYNNDYLCYENDDKGDENTHLFCVNLKTKKIIDETPFQKTKVEIIQSSPTYPNELLIGLNNRNAKWHDVYKLNFVTQKLSLVEKNNQFTGFIADNDLNLRLATKPTDENSPIFYIKNKQGTWTFLEQVPFEDALTTSFLGFAANKNIVYKMDSQHSDTASLYQYDISTKKLDLIASDSQADLDNILFHPTTHIPQAWASEYLKSKWHILDPNIAQDFAYLEKKISSNFLIISRNLADNKWLIQTYSDTNPSKYYLYERNPKNGNPLKITFLFTTFKSFLNLPLASMHPIIIKSRDNLNLISYLTIPLTTPVNSKGIPVKPLPMVLLVHGGPWARDSWRLERETQWLANRGYAVLSVNYRGSTGFGKNFVNAGNKEWAGKMHTDLIDAVNWAIQNKIADSKKIAIMGGSYGGYATLVGLTFTPELFACGVSIVGPSNLLTLLKTIPPYWKPDIALFKKRVGDITTKEGRKLLKERSPLTYVDNIKRPLLLLQGEHDPRVNKREAEQIFRSMQKKSLSVTYVLYHDEGHGFLREPNRISSNAIIEQFLAKNLGGKAEPIGNDFKGANFTIFPKASRLQ